MKINIKREDGILMPKKATIGSSGFDLFLNLKAEQMLKIKVFEGTIINQIEIGEEEPRGIILNPGTRVLIPLGFSLEMPKLYEAQIRPRSGLALKQGIIVVNSPGTIDEDYRGEVGVILMNISEEPQLLKNNTAIAQMVFTQLPEITLEDKNNLSKTKRGDGGYGSTTNEKQ